MTGPFLNTKYQSKTKGCSDSSLCNYFLFYNFFVVVVVVVELVFYDPLTLFRSFRTRSVSLATPFLGQTS